MTKRAMTVPDVRKDVLFCWVLSNPEILQPILEAISEKPADGLEVPAPQCVYQRPDGSKGVRFDVRAMVPAPRPRERRAFDIEMQQAKDEDAEQRATYYTIVLGRMLLDRGTEYSELGESYVAFFCGYDPYGLDRARYELETVVKDTEPPIVVDTRTHTLFFAIDKAAKEKNPILREAMVYMATGLVTGELSSKMDTVATEVLADDLYAKEVAMVSAVMSSAMSQAMKQGEEQGREQGLEQGLEQGVELCRSALQRLSTTLGTEKAAALLLEVGSAEDLEALLKELDGGELE